MFLALADNLGAESGLRTLAQLGVIILENVKLLLNLIDPTDSNVASSFETIGDFEGMDALIQKFLGLLKNGTSKDNYTSRSISDLIVLRSRKLSQEPCSLMMNLNNKKVEC